ncbi:MAG: cell wall hydrolase [Halanaerobiales bacterium]
MKNKKLVTMIFVLMLLLIVVEPIMAWTYTVKHGETLWSIARKYGVSVNGIRNATGYWGDSVKPGQKLNIPSNNSQSIDMDLFARVVEAEAGGEPYKGKVGVASVIINRKEDSRFPNSIRGVIYQRHAFESVTNNLIWRVKPSSQSYQAARDAMKGFDPTYDSVFFWNPYKPVTPWIWSRPIVVQYGDHVFAR